METVIDEKRLAKITRLSEGVHKKFSDGYCAMEAVAYVSREPFSDHPECACPVISSFVRTWNDTLQDDERNTLLMPFIPRLVGTRGSTALEERRSLMAADWLIRTHTPAWLRLAGLAVHAEALGALPEITSMAQVPSIRGPLQAARKDAAAAWDAAWAAAGGAAAWAAAGDAARAAARAAAIKKLALVRTELQASAVLLLERMIAATDEIQAMEVAS